MDEQNHEDGYAGLEYILAGINTRYKMPASRWSSLTGILAS